MKTHTHTAKTTKTYCFSGPVSRDQNRAAHGNICEVDTCECGATRAMNINGRHIEIGAWIEPHVHSVEWTTILPYVEPVRFGEAQNSLAHGLDCKVEICECGAIRRTNVNGADREEGPWIEVDDGPGCSPSIIVWSSTHNETVRICRRCEARLLAHNRWPKDSEGAEFRLILDGPYFGVCDVRAGLEALRSTPPVS